MGSIDSSFEPGVYTRGLVFSLPEGVALARALIAAVPAGYPGVVMKAAERLVDRTESAQQALLELQGETGPLSVEDCRTLDFEMDAVWEGLCQRLEGYASLPSRITNSRRAAELLRALFGNEGTSFLKESYAVQATTMQTLLRRIENDNLTKALDALCGPEFLEQINTLMPRYERMVQAMLNRDGGSGQSLLHHRHILSRAVVGYATAVCATVDEQDPASVEKACRALAPLSEFRTVAASRHERS